ncbi:DUF4132 domain-containing protein [Micromonospora sp. AMSO1212t]|uniref:DUF4132 domain-containing protein n=1 Tax=Micromonospora sp. AMSO1212t TaxID=2650565 RepID=UPI00124B4414|nr:DUF4132 domain-containing protein [Micromonospora sp. AMSO1212t]KAB1907911.1 DUF4132 domain-containing protein [Micromonospora sp. AMSO1212t]
MDTYDPEPALRDVVTTVEGWYERPDRTLNESSRLRFVDKVVTVCGWAPAGTVPALLAALNEPRGPGDLAPPQAELLAEATRQAESVAAAVADLAGDDADDERRAAAALTVAGRLPRLPLQHESPWDRARGEAWRRTTELLTAQPAPVRQVVFDVLTVPGEHRAGQGTLIRAVRSGGGIDGASWLDRLGGQAWLGFGGWSTNLIRFTWESIQAEASAGRTNPAALATWRRTRIERPLSNISDEADRMWPIPNVGEQWADRAIADIEAMPADRRSAWQALLAHCPVEADKARPTAGWRRQGRSLVDAVGADEFTARLDDWLPLVGQARTLPLRWTTCCPGHLADVPPRVVDRYNVGLLWGLIWMRAMCPPSQESLRSLGQIAERAVRKIPGHGPASPKLANVAVAALVDTDHPAALAQLARLSSRLTYKSTLRLVEKGLTRHAEALGVSREDVEEMALPGFGLPLADKLGDCSYELEVRGVDAQLVWRNADGKVVKAPPAQVRRDHGEEVKELKATVVDVAATLVATRDRLEGLLRRDRSWTVEQWRERFLDHPLARALARRLVWTVDGVACCWAGEALRTVDAAVFEPADDATVRLWHPVLDPDAVGPWRDFLTRHAITQPFKQAHREQYLLTDAERATSMYSNRFAAHVVLQHRLNALLSRRGWSYVQHRNDGASYSLPWLALPDWGLRAELGVAGIEDRGDDLVFDTMGTDQLFFIRGERLPVPLTEVPPVVLSEVMRDVDLFVAAAGVGADPDWYDGGPGGRYRDYWAQSSFGELAPTGRTRRDVLADLIPRLAIADRCTLTDRFLEVRGDLHTYRIHCGSGNILIAPDERYLCVIPDSAKAKEPEMFLPFEGDSRLGEILSKALLLAADKKIKDPVILRQL